MLTEAMIDARVAEAVRQHQQKMDWLHTEAAAGEGATGAAADGKMGFTLPHGTPPPQAFSGNILELLSPYRDSKMGAGVKNGTKSEAPPPKDGTPV